MKKLLTLTLVVIMTLSLAACGGTNGTQPSINNVTSQSAKGAANTENTQDTQNAEEASPESSTETDMPIDPLAYEVFPRQVYTDGFVAREGDKNEFFPTTGDYLLYTQTYKPIQSSCLVSFDSKGNVVQVRMRKINEWEHISGMDEMMSQYDNAILLKDTLYYDLDPQSISGDWGDKLAAFERVAHGFLGDVHTQYPESVYFTSMVKSSETEAKYIENNADPRIFEIINLVVPKSDDYVLRRNTNRHQEPPSSILNEDMERVTIHNEYSMYMESLTVFGKDGEVIEERSADVCASVADANERVKELEDIKKQGETGYSYTQHGNVIVYKSGDSPDPVDNKSHVVSLYKEENRDKYLSKPFLTDRQIQYLLEQAAAS